MKSILFLLKYHTLHDCHDMCIWIWFRYTHFVALCNLERSNQKICICDKIKKKWQQQHQQNMTLFKEKWKQRDSTLLVTLNLHRLQLFYFLSFLFFTFWSINFILIPYQHIYGLHSSTNFISVIHSSIIFFIVGLSEDFCICTSYCWIGMELVSH